MFNASPVTCKLAGDLEDWSSGDIFVGFDILIGVDIWTNCFLAEDIVVWLIGCRLQFLRLWSFLNVSSRVSCITLWAAQKKTVLSKIIFAVYPSLLPWLVIFIILLIFIPLCYSLVLHSTLSRVHVERNFVMPHKTVAGPCMALRNLHHLQTV